jgi:hypothetical protein
MIGEFYGQPFTIVYKLILFYLIISLIISNGMVKRLLGNPGIILSDMLIAGFIPFILGNILAFPLNLKWIVTNLLDAVLIGLSESILILIINYWNKKSKLNSN